MIDPKTQERCSRISIWEIGEEGMDRDIVSESNGIKRVVIEKEDDLYTQRKKKNQSWLDWRKEYKDNMLLWSSCYCQAIVKQAFVFPCFVVLLLLQLIFMFHKYLLQGLCGLRETQKT